MSRIFVAGVGAGLAAGLAHTLAPMVAPTTAPADGRVSSLQPVRAEVTMPGQRTHAVNLTRFDPPPLHERLLL